MGELERIAAAGLGLAEKPVGPQVVTVNEDEVFEAIRVAVDAGEYVDWLPGVQAPRPGHSAADNVPAKNAPGGRGYVRGTSEHRRARALGLVARLPRPPLATMDAVVEVEEEIRYPLPPLLRRLYLEVANGGFGPRSGGILGACGNDRRNHGNWSDLLDVHRAFHSGPGPHVPRQMLWLYDWGCAIWSLVDCSSSEGPMRIWDPSGEEHPTPDNSLFRHGMTLTEWLTAWLRGRLDDPPMVTRDDLLGHEIPGQLSLFNHPPGPSSHRRYGEGF